jgi:hypothetical protein
MDKTIRRYTNFDDTKADEYRYWQSRPVHERIADPRIRELLLKLMNVPSRRGDAVELLTSNHEDGDFRIIEHALRGTIDVDDLHSISMGVRHLTKVHCPPDAANSLGFLYENGPCSICRGELVERLSALKSVPEWMREECLFDSNPDTRKLVV